MKMPALIAITLLLSLTALAPVRALADENTNNNAYAVNDINGSVDVIDTRTNLVVATIPGFNHPFCATVSPDGKLLYVCSQPNNIIVVNTQTNSVSATITLPGALGFIGDEGSAPQVAFSRYGERAFVIASGGGVNSALFVINTEDNTVVSSTSFGATFLLAVAVSHNSGNIYLGSSNGVIVLDGNTLSTVTTLAPGHDIFNLAISPNGKLLYGADESGLLGQAPSNGVLVVDAQHNTVVTTVPLPFSSSNPSFATGLAVTPDGHHVYAESFSFKSKNSTVTVIDVGNNSIATTITANGLSLNYIAITPNGREVLAVNSVLSTTVNSTVAVIDPRTNTIVNSVNVGLFADALATQPPADDSDDGDD